MRALLKQCSVSAVAVAVLMMAGCSQSTKPSVTDQSAAAGAPAGPPELVTAKTAFWPMYKSAMAWSGDAQVIRLSQKDVPGFKNQAGKAAMWEAAIGSPGKHQYRLYTFAIATVLPDIHKGAAAGNPRPWSGQTREAMPIDVTVFNTDSDTAYKTSAADAAAWLAKNPDKPLTSLELGSTYDFKSPVWYIAWGNKKSGGYISLVNATSGTLYKKK
jgi:hypothetical protein